MTAPNPRAAPFTPTAFSSQPRAPADSSFDQQQQSGPPAGRPSFSAAAPSFKPSGAGVEGLSGSAASFTGLGAPPGVGSMQRAVSTMNPSSASAAPFVPKALVSAVFRCEAPDQVSLTCESRFFSRSRLHRPTARPWLHPSLNLCPTFDRMHHPAFRFPTTPH